MISTFKTAVISAKVSTALTVTVLLWFQSWTLWVMSCCWMMTAPTLMRPQQPRRSLREYLVTAKQTR